MPPDLIAFMRWIGLVEVNAPPKPQINWGGEWYRDCEIPF